MCSFGCCNLILGWNANRGNLASKVSRPEKGDKNTEWMNGYEAFSNGIIVWDSLCVI